MQKQGEALPLWAEDRMKTPLPLKCYIKLDNEILIPAVWWDEFSYFKIRINEL